MFSLEKARDFAASAVSSIRTRAMMSEPVDDMKGLHNFIMRIRLCNGPEDEEKIVNQELAKIRGIFKKPAMDGYTKRKSICKLLYVFLLGKQVSFGQSEALSLLSSNILVEKQIGYLFISVLFNPQSDINALLIQCIKTDLESHNPKFAYLAIHCVANIGNKEMSAALSGIIFDVVKKKTVPDFVMQSALLCLLKLVRVSDQQSISPEWCIEVMKMMSQGNLGVVFNAISLLDEFIKVDSEINSKKTDIVRIVVSELRRILSEIRPGLHEYKYGTVPAPWHLVNLMRILKNFGIPQDDYSKLMLEDVLNTILDKVQEPVDSGKIRRDLKCTNARYAVFFEAVGVIVGNTDNQKLWTRAQAFAGWLLGHKISNFRYLALEASGQLANSNFCTKSMENIQKKAMIYLNKETDPSIQQRAVDFLCSISNRGTIAVPTIVEDLLLYTKNPECAIRGAVASKIAAIAEKSFPSYTWYVGTLIQLLATAGDVVDDNICSKIVKTVSARSEVQNFAAGVAFKALMEPYPHEKLLIAASFILGDFGYLISDSDATALMQFQILKSKYAHCSAETKAVILSSFLKMAHNRSVLRKPVCDLFQENSTSCDLEVQKRSVEYLKLLEMTNNGFLSAILRAMPPTECERRFTGSNPLENLVRVDRARGDDQYNTPTIYVQVPSDFGPFVLANKGVFYDDVVLKITSDSSYQGSHGNMTVTFETNVLSMPFSSNSKLLSQDSTKLAVKFSQKNQRKSKRMDMHFSFECHQIFDQQPKVYIELSLDNAIRFIILLNLPVFVNKFFEPVPMTEQVFGERWHTLEAQSTAIDRFFKSTKSNDLISLKAVLTNSNLSLLEMKCPHPSMRLFGCGGVCQTSQSAIGCLVRLEVDELVQSFRMSVRSPNPTLATQVAELLQNVL